MMPGQLRVRTQKCSLCDWTMPSWFDTSEEIKAAFTGHRTSIVGCAEAKLVPIEGSENAPVGEMYKALQKIIDKNIPQISSSIALEREAWDVQMGHKKMQ